MKYNQSWSQNGEGSHVSRVCEMLPLPPFPSGVHELSLLLLEQQCYCGVVRLERWLCKNRRTVAI